MRGGILFVELGIDATNDDLLDRMRTMKACREDGSYSTIVCTVRGFRVVNLGFISYLDFTTTFDTTVPAIAKVVWGAAEVWLSDEGDCGARWR